jgi:amino acid transporter
VMFAQVIGFGTDEAGLTAFQSSGNTLGDLGSTFVGQWFSLIIILTAIVSAFGCHMATTAASARMLYAFGRDGFGPRALAHIHESTGGPRRATWLVVVVALVVNLICGAVGWPDMGTGNDAIDTYFLFAVAGSVCLMVSYLLVDVAAAWFVGAPKFVGVHGGRAKALGLTLPLLGALVIVVVLWFNVKGAETWSAAPLLGLYWCALGLVIAIAASGIAKRVGESLIRELELTPPVQASAQ